MHLNPTWIGGIATTLAILATDLVVIVSVYPFLNPGLTLASLLLESALIRLLVVRAPKRAFWVGFQVAGWAYLAANIAWICLDENFHPLRGNALGFKFDILNPIDPLTRMLFERVTDDPAMLRAWNQLNEAEEVSLIAGANLLFHLLGLIFAGLVGGKIGSLCRR